MEETTIDGFMKLVNFLATYIGAPAGVIVIIGLAVMAIRLAYNLYKVHDARSDGTIQTYEQFNKFMESKEREVERLTQLAHDASQRANEAYKERNDAVANSKAQEVRIEVLTSQVSTLNERIKHLEDQIRGLMEALNVNAS